MQLGVAYGVVPIDECLRLVVLQVDVPGAALPHEGELEGVRVGDLGGGEHYVEFGKAEGCLGLFALKEERTNILSMSVKTLMTDSLFLKT